MASTYDISKIVVPCDGSETSERAWDVALELALRFDANLICLHVQATPQPDMTQPQDPAQWAQQMQEAAAKSQQLLEHFQSKAQEQGVSVQRMLKSGKPDEVICAVAEQEHADLVVMGSRGLNSARRTTLGSVADAVVHNCDCNVFVVRPPS